MRPVAVFTMAAMFFGSCGAFLGRIPFSGDGQGQTVVHLARGDVAFWTQLDAEYRGDMSAAYDVELWQQGEPVGRTICDPIHLGLSRVCTIRIIGSETHTIHCRMACVAHVDRGGETVVHAKLSIPVRPSDLQLHEADLIVKQ